MICEGFNTYRAINIAYIFMAWCLIMHRANFPVIFNVLLDLVDVFLPHNHTNFIYQLEGLMIH
jgi:hypothetical protein